MPRGPSVHVSVDPLTSGRELQHKGIYFYSDSVDPCQLMCLTVPKPD